jgi:hypothetical protein
MKRFIMGTVISRGELEVEIDDEKDITLRFENAEVITMSLEEFRQVVFWVDFIEEHKLNPEAVK